MLYSIFIYNIHTSSGEPFNSQLNYICSIHFQSAQHRIRARCTSFGCRCVRVSSRRIIGTEENFSTGLMGFVSGWALVVWIHTEGEGGETCSSLPRLSIGKIYHTNTQDRKVATQCRMCMNFDVLFYMLKWMFILVIAIASQPNSSTFVSSKISCWSGSGTYQGFPEGISDWSY